MQGAVQMCVSILDVMGEHASALNIDPKTREEWLLSYIGVPRKRFGGLFACSLFKHLSGRPPQSCYTG
jgi:hypothetical protein